MMNENDVRLSATDANVVTALTAEQAEQVAGGGFAAAALLRVGCPSCTSGLQLGFANLVAVVNPAPAMI